MENEDLIAAAAGRLAEIDFSGTQINAISSLLHALY